MTKILKIGLASNYIFLSIESIYLDSYIILVKTKINDNTININKTLFKLEKNTKITKNSAFFCQNDFGQYQKTEF